MKYITNFFRVGCVALLAMLILAPGAFAQLDPPTPPDPPTDLEARAGAVDTESGDQQGRITLTWTPVPEANNGGRPVTDYIIEVSQDYDAANPTAATWVVLEVEETAPSGDVTKYTAEHNLSDEDPSHNLTRHYRVKAMSILGIGDPSGVASAATHNVPDPPTDLAAVTGNSTDADEPQNGRITLTWSPIAEDNNGGLAVANTTGIENDGGYVLEFYDPTVDLANTEPWTQIVQGNGNTFENADPDASPAVPKFTVVHVFGGAGVTYRYRVRARSAAGLGSPSAEASGTTHDVPDAPTGVATGDVVKNESTPEENDIPISWNAVPDANNGGLPVTGYEVEVLASDADNWADITQNTQVAHVAGKVDTVHANLSENTQDPPEYVTYFYRVRAVSAAGTGEWSSITSGVKLAPPGAPTMLTVRAVDGVEAIDLSWTPPVNTGEPRLTGYRIERWPGENVPDGTDPDLAVDEHWDDVQATFSGRSYRDRGPDGGFEEGTKYNYRISAINAVAQGAVSNIEGAISSNKALMPLDLTATVAEDMSSVGLSWNGPKAEGEKPGNGGSPITGYKIEVSEDGGATWADVEPEKPEHPFLEVFRAGGIKEFSYTHENVKSGTSYTYRVSAINDAGAGAPSASSAAVSISAALPDAPTGLTATAAAATSITLAWSEPDDDGGADITSWEIEVSEDAGVTWADLDIPVTDPDPDADPPTTKFSAVHTDLDLGATYHYRVSATNSEGTGAHSTVANATVRDVPGAPTGLTATADGENAIKLAWTAPAPSGGSDITGYKIESSPDGTEDTWENLEDDTGTTDVTYTDEGLSPETKRYYRVSAINDELQTGAASNIANATTAAKGIVTRYAVSSGGSSSGNCTNSANPCTMEAALRASGQSDNDAILVRIRRAGETATIEDATTINKMVTLGVYVRGASAAAKGAVRFTGSVKLNDGGDLMTHEDASVHFDELEVTGTPSIDKLTVAKDLTISEDDEDNTTATVLAVDELTVNSGQTLTIGEGTDVRVRLTKGAEGKRMNGKLDVKGTIDGGGDLWIAHTSGERAASGFMQHEPGDYLPDAAIAPSKVKFTADDCLMVTGGGTIENDLYLVAAGNVCVILDEIANLVAVGSIAGTEDITTDVIFRNGVTVNGNVQQWNDARIVFEKNTTIDGDVVMDYGDPGIGTDFGNPNSDTDNFERTGSSGLEFAGTSNTIEGDLSLKFDGESGSTQAIFGVDSGEYAMSTVEGDLIIEDGGGIRLEGAPGNRADRTDNPRAHNLSVEGDVFVYANAGIMMQHAATSTIEDGLCSAPGLRFGTKVILSGDIVFTEGATLTISALVIADDVEVEEEGTLVASTVHITEDGELEAEGNIRIRDALVLQGNGLEGSLAAGSTVNNLTYATVDSDEIDLGATVARLSVNAGADRELRLSEAVTVTNLGLCTGTLVLIDTDTSANTLTVTDLLTVMDGYLSLDSNRPGSSGTDTSTPSAATDGYILKYVTAGEREAGSEWFAPRKVAVDHKDAVVIVKEAKTLVEGVHLFKGHLHMKGEGAHLTVGMARSVSGISPFVMVDNAELHSNGNNVVVHGTVRVATGTKEVGKIVTGGGELHVLGQNPGGVYTNESAAATVGVGGTIDVGMGALQLGPAYTAAGNGLAGDDRPDVTLTLNKSDDGAGTVTGKVYVPKGSKQTFIHGEAFDTVVLDGTGNAKRLATGADNWGGGLNFHNKKVTIDSLAAMNDGSIEFYDQLGDDEDSFAIEIKKDVELNSARIYVNQKNSLKFGGNLTFGDTGGMRVWDHASVTVMGDYKQNKGSQHAGHQDGLGLAGTNTFTAMGDFMVADSAHRVETTENTSIVLKGDFHVGNVLSGSDKMLNANLEFSGKEAQTVGSKVDLGDVVVKNSAGLVLSDSVSQGASSMLTLTTGVISSDMYSTWTLKNTGIEEDVRGRNNALTTCDDDENCATVITGGSRRTHMTGGVSRHVMKGSSGGGEMSGGYLFPVGGMDGERARYRPLILQLEDDLTEAMSVTVSPMMGSEDAGEINIVVSVQGGSLTLNAYADMFWKVESKETPDQNPHIRIAASGLANVFDDSRLRMVQWDCDDWGNARLAGTQIIGTNEDSFAENGFVNGVLNLTQQSVEIGTCAILGVAANGIENPIHEDPLTGGIARIQFIHNLQLPFPVDLFLDGVKLAGGLDFQSATGYGHYAAGDHTISVMPVGATDVPADPMEIALPSLVNEQSYAVVVHGSLASENATHKILNTKLRSSVDNMVEAILVHGSGDLGEVDVRVLDPADNMTPTKLLANNFGFDSATRYISLAAGAHSVQVTSPDNRTEIEVYYLDLNGYQGETVILNLSGGMADLQLMGVRNNGDVFLSQMVTGVEEEGNPEIPTEFTLHGNYPNPFNPSTRIQFDLPESARVSLQVVDMLGRQVLTLPAKQVEAGANRTLELSATNLASGQYLYRIIATGAESRYVKTGRLTLVK